MPIEIANAAPEATVDNERRLVPAMWRGASARCPHCGEGRLYNGYLKVVDACSTCGEEMHHQRADDAPPYFTIFIVGHVILAGVLALEQAMKPSAWLHAAIWVPLTLALSLWLLPIIKGALVGLQWALRMHGFGTARDPHLDALPDTAQPKDH